MQAKGFRGWKTEERKEKRRKGERREGKKAKPRRCRIEP